MLSCWNKSTVLLVSVEMFFFLFFFGFFAHKGKPRWELEEYIPMHGVWILVDTHASKTKTWKDLVEHISLNKKSIC